MTLNDAHIFVRPDQIKEELKRVVNLTLEVYKDFGLEITHSVYLTATQQILKVLCG